MHHRISYDPTATAAEPWHPSQHRPASQASSLYRHSVRSIPTTRRSMESRPSVRTSYSLERNKEDTPKLKLVVVGDGECGKTSLLMVHTTGIFPKAYVPTVFETLQSTVVVPEGLLHRENPTWTTRVSHLLHRRRRRRHCCLHTIDSKKDTRQQEGKRVRLSLWDTAGQEDYDRLRPLSYTDASILLVCFSIDHPASLVNVSVRWSPEVACFCPRVPVLLVGCKSDRRRSCPTSCIPREQCEAVARQIGAMAYMECSALQGHGIDALFEKAAALALLHTPPPPRPHQCILL